MYCTHQILIKEKENRKSLYSQNIRETACAIKAENRWNHGKFVKLDWLYNKKTKKWIHGKIVILVVQRNKGGNSRSLVSRKKYHWHHQWQFVKLALRKDDWFHGKFVKLAVYVSSTL